MKPLAGQTALITGAAAPRGIGRAIALRLAEDGAAVAVTDVPGMAEIGGRKLDRISLLEDAAASVRAAGGAAMSLPLDVTRAEDIQSGLARIESALGPVGILVNNAGSLVGSAEFLTTTSAQWETSFRVNLLGPVMLAQAVIPGMKKRGGGRIINIGSTGSLGAEPGFGAYTAMKHGLTGFSKTLAAEFGPDGILCNTICPGYIATDMHEAANARLARETGCTEADVKAQRYAAVALRGAGRPEDVAEAAAYLAGPAAAYVTGINLPVAGGVPFGI